MTRRPHRRQLTAVLAALSLLVALVPTAAAAAAEDGLSPGEVTELGMPVTGGQTSPDVAYGEGPDGEPYVFFFFNGSSTVTSQFVVLDVRAGEVVFHERVPHGSSTWGVEWSDAEKAVYLGTADSGHLYRYVPGTETIEDLGRPAPGLRVWSLSVDPAGTVWIGTYPEARVVSYDPETGQSRDYGRMSQTREYVSSVEWHDGTLYAGLRSPRALVQIDPDSGETQEVEIPEEWGEDWNGVRDLHSRGSYLLIALEHPVEDSTLLFYDTVQRTVVHEDPDFRGREVSQVAPDGSSVYYRSMAGRTTGAAQIVRWDMGSMRVGRAVPWSPNAVANVLDFIDMGPDAAEGEHLLLCGFPGRCYTRSLSTTEATYVDVTDQIEPTGARLLRTHVGPDGNVYFSGYLSPPGMGQWDPHSESFALLGGTGQLEGLATFGDRLVLGRYPGAGLMTWDTTQPWPGGSFVYPANAESQDRPMDFLDIGETMLVATTPTAQNHGGAILEWDGVSAEAEVHRNVIPDHTPITLAQTEDGTVWFGTSRYGGYGIDPVDGSAQLVAWDLDSGEVLHSTTIIEGAASVNGLAVDPTDGTLWGLVRGTIFNYDPQARELISSTTIYEDTWTMSQFQEEFDLKFDSEGRLFGLSEGHVFAFNTETLQARTLVEHAHGFDIAGSESIYFTVDSMAYRYDIPADAVPQPEVVTPLEVVFVDEDGTEDDTYTVPEVEGVEYVLDGEVIEAGTHRGEGTVVITARAVEGYELAEGAVSEWSHVFDASEPDPGPGPGPGPAPLRYGFFLNNEWSATADVVFQYGRHNDEVLIGDWDGDGTDTIMVRRGNAFYLNNAQQGGPAERVFTYGQDGDVVLVGDWNGNGHDTLAVRRGNEYFVKNSLEDGRADEVVSYGRAGDEVLVGNWDGEGGDTFAVRRGNHYFVKNTIADGNADHDFRYGRAGDEVLAGDWDGDGADTFAVRRANVYFINNSLTGGNADLELAYGRAGDAVYVGDWDGDGTDTLGVRRTP